MKEKVKLKKLVQIVGDLLKIEGNEWLIDELLRTIGENSSLDEISKNSIIQNINEFCIEQKIEKQATDFYLSFPITEIKNQLITDFRKMEHERRRDDFENFCLCIYQQIENISNFLFDNRIQGVWNSNREAIAVKSVYDKENRKYIVPNQGGITLEKLIFQKTDPSNMTDLSKWFANHKFRAVLYFFYFNKNIAKDEYNFNSVYFIHQEIYQIRNQNHRGGKASPYQKKTLNKIKGNEGRYYFKFYGFLQDFVSQIESSIENPNMENSKSINSKPQKNNLGAFSSDLEQLSKKMKKSE